MTCQKRSAAFLVLTLLLVAYGAEAYTTVRDANGSLDSIRFPDDAITIVLQEDGSADIAGDASLDAIRDAMAVWGGPTCTALTFVDGGTSSNGSNGSDGTNRIAFRESNWPGGANGAGAMTTRHRNTGPTPQTWSEADILFNGVEFEWSVSGATQRYDVMAIAVHELGHVLGLQHTPEPTASMYFGGNRGTTYQRTLHPDDERGVCFLYPAATFSCSNDIECPQLHAFYGGGGEVRLTCQGGSCVEGQAPTFGDCYQNAHCQSGSCVDDPQNGNGDDPGFCAVTCSPDGSVCEGDGQCVQGVCLRGYDGCFEDADCPGSNNVCALDLDGVRRCLNLCLQNDHCADPLPGAVCHGGTGANPPGFCRLPGAGALGESCEDGSDCASLACVNGGATPTCDDQTPGYVPGMPPEPEPSPAPEPEPIPEPAPEPAPNVDGGSPLAEPEPGVDGGSAEPEPNPEPGGDGDGDGDGDGTPGCACDALPPLSPLWWTLLGLGGFTVRRRRRRG